MRTCNCCHAALDCYSTDPVCPDCREDLGLHDVDHPDDTADHDDFDPADDETVSTTYPAHRR